ncbi:MAG: MmgE/PrpD family protein [Pseudomonadota bacterium]
MTITQALCDRVVAIKDEQIPAIAFEHANRLVSDGLAVAFAGTRLESGPGILAEHVREMGTAEQAHLIGFPAAVAVSQAAYVNGTSMHVLDFEPMWSPATHALSPTLPVALALGEHLNADGREIAAALIKGIEVQGWLRVASNQFEPRELRFHPPGLVGPLGAAVTAGHLLGLDAASLANALGIAASRCGSLFANVGSMTKSSHCGLAGALGLDAALLSTKGFTGNASIFDDPRGYGFAYSDDFDATVLTNFGPPFRVVDPGYAIKLFPSQFGTHFAIAAGLAARQLIDDPTDIKQVVLTTPSMGYVDRPTPLNGLDGKFSWQYTLACALLDNHVGLDTFSDAKRFAPQTQAMLERIAVEVDSAIPGNFEDAYVRLTITRHDGESISVKSDGPPGKWGQPAIDPAIHRDKLVDCLSRGLSPDATDGVLMRTARFSELNADEVGELMTALSVDREPAAARGS